MRTVEIIEKKRNGLPLNGKEIAWFVQQYTAGKIPDYQAAALLMAIYFKGLNAEETAVLTDEMAASGDRLDLSTLGPFTADKHSTGGVGDKTTLITAPLAAAAGVKVAKMSGRGLGFTGGTVDKLEAIPGYCTELSQVKFLSQVQNVGMAVIGQTGNLTPADKKLYALRDVTATVESLPLIASSIMSKKLAAGAQTIVLDVKYGSGAFMKTKEQAEQLAECMVEIGKRCGRNMAALITNMQIPLGCEIGNANEVQEAVRVLCGQQAGPLRELCLELAANMVSLSLKQPYNEAVKRVTELLENGSAFKKMKEWVAAQGGNVAYLENPELFQKASENRTVLSPKSAYITAMDSAKIGQCCVRLGAGRSVKDEKIDFSAGITLLKHTGEFVQQGEPLALLHTNKKNILPETEGLFCKALTFGAQPPQVEPFIYKTLRA